MYMSPYAANCFQDLSSLHMHNWVNICETNISNSNDDEDEDEDEDEAEDEKEDEDDDDDDEEDGWLVMMGEIYGPRSLNECARRPCDSVLVC